MKENICIYGECATISIYLWKTFKFAAVVIFNVILSFTLGDNL